MLSSGTGLAWALLGVAGVLEGVWVGIGAAGTALPGMVPLDEPATVARLVCLGRSVAGVLGMRFPGGG